MNYHIDPITWFSERKLDHTPPHFVLSNVPSNRERIQWIYNNCLGRFSEQLLIDQNTASLENFPAFEDPKEELFYTLRWG